MNSNAINEITLRPVADIDEPFLFAVYSSTRSSEVAAFGWDQSQQEEFLRMQFTMQQRAYKMQYPNAEHSIILNVEFPAGRIIVDRAAAQISLTDIAILPGFRKNGIATRLIKQLQDEAAASGKPLALSVDKNNSPALRLYKSLGFLMTGESEFIHEMEWKG